MCLAVPGKIVEARDGTATVDLRGNRLEVQTVLTPEARSGDWVLVHAGFAITRVAESDALLTWDYLRGYAPEALLDEAGRESEPGRGVDAGP